MTPNYPELPIVTPDPPRKTQAEKYGGLFYAGIAGLVVTLGLLAYFSLGVASLRPVLNDVYRLHDARLPVEARIEAAYRLRHDPQFTQRQAYDIAVDGQSLPPLARYLVAEALTEEASRPDPRAYGLAVERSTGWPDWFRFLMFRPLAHGAGNGQATPAESVQALTRNPDPVLGLWAEYTRAAGLQDQAAAATLTAEAAGGGPRSALAALLVEALHADGKTRSEWLNRATLLARTQHPGAAKLWEGWQERGGHLQGPTTR